MAVTFFKRSIVPASPSEIWPVVTSPEGINFELMPVMRMTVPRQLKGKAIHEMPVRQKIGRSWFFLLGFLPIDFDDITIAELDDGRRFLERSTMMSMSAWEHERTLVERDGGTEVSDRVMFKMRPPLGWVPGAHAVIGTLLRWLFEHRHRRLVRWFQEHRVLALPGKEGSSQVGEGVRP
jgi:ligand-binding SRPBCC domain-containing protein